MKGEVSAAETLVDRSKRVDMHGKRLQVVTDGIVCDEDSEWSTGTWRGGYLLIFSYYILHIFVKWEAKQNKKQKAKKKHYSKFKSGVRYSLWRAWVGSSLHVVIKVAYWVKLST